MPTRSSINIQYGDEKKTEIRESMDVHRPQIVNAVTEVYAQQPIMHIRTRLSIFWRCFSMGSMFRVGLADQWPIPNHICETKLARSSLYIPTFARQSMRLSRNIQNEADNVCVPRSTLYHPSNHGKNGCQNLAINWIYPTQSHAGVSCMFSFEVAPALQDYICGCYLCIGIKTRQIAFQAPGNSDDVPINMHIC